MGVIWDRTLFTSESTHHHIYSIHDDAAAAAAADDDDDDYDKDDSNDDDDDYDKQKLSLKKYNKVILRNIMNFVLIMHFAHE